MNESHTIHLQSNLPSDRNTFEQLLLSTHREGIAKVLHWLDEEGFYDSPASARNHDSFKGGLLAHSLKVCDIALRMWKEMPDEDQEKLGQTPRESIILCSLLHDVCKLGLYREKADGTFWRARKTLAKGHGKLSVTWLEEQGLLLNDEEKLAIRWHMGPYTQDYGEREWPSDAKAALSHPLVKLVHKADSLSCRR